MSKYDEFVKKHLGKAMDYDGAYGVQCVDLIKYYLKECFSISAGSWGNAHCYWDEFESHQELKDNFTRTKSRPQKGDIVVWDEYLSTGRTGHIAIATGESNNDIFYSYDCNWGSKPMKKVKHNYLHFAGVLRPKNKGIISDERRVRDNLNGYTNKKFQEVKITIPKGTIITLINPSIGIMKKNGKEYEMSQIKYNGKCYYVARKYLEYV